MTDPLAWIDAGAASWRRRGLERKLVPSERGAASTIIRNDRALINLGSNDYLNLAGDPRIVAAARGSLAKGWGSGASALVSGWSLEHETLANEIAAFEETEAAVLYPTGYAANVGAITALVGRGDVIYSDALNHASLIDGARLSGATVRKYAHGDASVLEHKIRSDKKSGEYRRGLIVTDGVFSMDGNLAPLERIVELAEEHELMLLVDEAHGTGVIGENGRGAAEYLGVSERIPIKVGTLSKALGSVGGFVAGSRTLIDWLINHSRPLVFSTAAPAATAAAASAALRVVIGEPERRAQLASLANRMRVRFEEIGVAVSEGITPIIPVVLGDPDVTMRIAESLTKAGFYVPAIRPPTVPDGTSRLRISVSSGLDAETIDRFIIAFKVAQS